MQKDNSKNGTTHRGKSQWDCADLIVILPAHIAPLSLTIIIYGGSLKQKGRHPNLLTAPMNTDLGNVLVPYMRQRNGRT